MIFLEFLALVAIILAVLAVVFAINWGRSRLDNNRREAVELRTRIRETERQLNKAEHTLRSVANGCGSPALEAQIALDDITRYYETKELN